MKKSKILYLVTNEAKESKEYYSKIEDSLKGGVDVLQLREKEMNSRDFYNRALKLKKLTAKYNKTFIINDRMDIALAVNADGLHIGQKDLPIKICREYMENKIIGVSVNSKEQAIKAYQEGANYLGLGALFETSSKNDYNLINDSIEKIIESIEIPIVGIGGIKLKHVENLIKAGLNGVAVISAILEQENSYIAAKRFKKELEKQI